MRGTLSPLTLTTAPVGRRVGTPKTPKLHISVSEQPGPQLQLSALTNRAVRVINAE